MKRSTTVDRFIGKKKIRNFKLTYLRAYYFTSTPNTTNRNQDQRTQYAPSPKWNSLRSKLSYLLFVVFLSKTG